jgi:hypothetical protein
MPQTVPPKPAAKPAVAKKPRSIATRKTKRAASTKPSPSEPAFPQPPQPKPTATPEISVSASKPKTASSAPIVSPLPFFEPVQSKSGSKPPAQNVSITQKEQKPATPPEPGKTVSTTGIKIPSILLEGDDPVTPPPQKQLTGEQQSKFSGPGPHRAAPPALPASQPSAPIVTGRLYVTARDPYCFYAHWDFPYNDQQRIASLSIHGAMTLRVASADGRHVAGIRLHRDSRHWFAHVPDANTAYSADLGYFDKSNRWISVAPPIQVRTPPDAATPGAQAERFVKMPADPQLPTQPAYFQSETARATHAEAMHIDGSPYSDIPLTPALDEHLQLFTAEDGPWTQDQEDALEEIISGSVHRKDAFDSAELVELLKGRSEFKRGRRQPSPEFPFPAPSSAELVPLGLSAELAEAISSIFPLPEQPRERSFWFDVNAELIVYGATDPSATVTIGGRPIRLRPDGSFSYRFALPDGDYELPAAAASVDGETRRATLRFNRSTLYGGDVGAHPQDESLQVPAPENTF